MGDAEKSSLQATVDVDSRNKHNLMGAATRENNSPHGTPTREPRLQVVRTSHETKPHGAGSRSTTGAHETINPMEGRGTTGLEPTHLMEEARFSFTKQLNLMGATGRGVLMEPTHPWHTSAGGRRLW